MGGARGPRAGATDDPVATHARQQPLPPARPAPALEADEIRKTYRYLRIGMVGAVVLIGTSIALERSLTDCFQTSISAYYYTPVRAVFVGAMVAVGLALIVYRGKHWPEDTFLNIAGMLAPVVAFVPTTDVGSCWAVTPDPLPKTPTGELQGWVVDNVNNNFNALVLTGFAGLAVAGGIAVFATARGKAVHWGTWVSLTVVLAILVLGAVLKARWDDFVTGTHGWAAVALFVALILAIVANALDLLVIRPASPIRSIKALKQLRFAPNGWAFAYIAIAVLMVGGAAFIFIAQAFGDHKIFAVETYEIVLFAVYWTCQTVQNWNEAVMPAQGPVASSP
jgi:hypothetical protein